MLEQRWLIGQLLDFLFRLFSSIHTYARARVCVCGLSQKATTLRLIALLHTCEMQVYRHCVRDFFGCTCVLDFITLRCF